MFTGANVDSDHYLVSKLHTRLSKTRIEGAKTLQKYSTLNLKEPDTCLRHQPQLDKILGDTEVQVSDPGQNRGGYCAGAASRIRNTPSNIFVVGQ